MNKSVITIDFHLFKRFIYFGIKFSERILPLF